MTIKSKLTKSIKFVIISLLSIILFFNFSHSLTFTIKKNTLKLSIQNNSKFTNTTIPLINTNLKKKDVVWTSSMYSIHRNWLDRKENPFKALNEIVKIKKYADNDD